MFINAMLIKKTCIVYLLCQASGYGVGPGGLDPCSFPQEDKVPFFVAVYCVFVK